MGGVFYVGNDAFFGQNRSIYPNNLKGECKALLFIQ